MIRWVLKLTEFNIEWEHHSGTQNAVVDVLSRNPVESIIGEKVNCAIIRDLVLSSREQLIEEQRKDPEVAVNETTGKNSAELFLGRKSITPFQKLVMGSDGTEFAVGDIESLFDEAKRNTKAKQEKWEKYYNRRRRDVQIKVNDWVLITTHPLSSAKRKW
ncbi:uncharacterized protein TNCV_4047441 [Trichonephila clavipes]|nr:uncharacterized protein TNCV_4047441 [Trichonephila clavipes]